MADQADVHVCYMEAVQAPRKEIRNLGNLYQQMYDRYWDGRAEATSGRLARMTLYPATIHSALGDETDDDDDGNEIPPKAYRLREDFCGTAVLCKEWVRHHVAHEAVGVDIDPEVIRYARNHTFQDATDAAKVRLVIGDVLTVDDQLSHAAIAATGITLVTPASGDQVECPDPLPAVHIVSCLNYSLFYFHRRTQLVEYLRRCYANLCPFGIVVADAFGGSRAMYDLPTVKTRRFANFTYHFEYRTFDLLTNVGRYMIHFEFADGSWKRQAFTYLFRLYSLVEIREAMLEAGFQQVHIWVTKPAVVDTGASGRSRNRPKSARRVQSRTNGTNRRGRRDRQKHAMPATGVASTDEDGGPSETEEEEEEPDEDDREYVETGHGPVPAMEQYNAYIVGVKIEPHLT
ncbi:hypothetical protein IWQ60_001818 [Tieghemiomyces parasiticus]|uniref:Uncharacterized protein n=1 Tax=Tieghemiomyces parasiticus TaxID=78921 RepID=A0A9W8AK24_9FUNG|nr:hypothetical protein IWQ60_001818 [Tieghemiomyces parasiticus]